MHRLCVFHLFFNRNLSWVGTESMIKPFITQQSILRSPNDKLEYIATHLETREQLINSLPSVSYSGALIDLPDLLLHVEDRILPGLIKVSAYLDGRSGSSGTYFRLDLSTFAQPHIFMMGLLK